MTQSPPAPTSHFEGKEAIQHVVEKQSKGMIESAEVHGSEAPGHVWAFADSAREMAVILAIMWVVLTHVFLFQGAGLVLAILTIVGAALSLWKTGRGALLGWSRLERLHRVLQEERWEIEHHRDQERDELKALYSAKGFEGQLLEDVVDVLMADGDRLLRVMLEEELGLSLETHEHPLKQGLFAGLGAVLAATLCGLSQWLAPAWGPLVSTVLVVSGGAALPAWYEKNQMIPAVVWNLGVTALACGSVYFFLDSLMIWLASIL